MTIDEMELLGLVKDVEPLSEDAMDQARLVLRATMFMDGEAGTVEAEHGRRRRTWAVRSAVGTGIAAALTAGVLVSTAALQTKSRPSHSLSGTRTRSVSVNAPLMHLADYITANDAPQPGNATLVIRTQSYPDRSSIGGADLYTDSGEYFYSQDESGLPEAIASDDNIGGGMFAREVAAAVYAVNGNLATAREEMADAPFPPGTHPIQLSPSASDALAAQEAAQGGAAKEKSAALAPSGPVTSATTLTAGQVDNYIWEDSLDALSAGAGNPQVRSGILRILSTLPEVTVTNSTADGQPAMTITASAPALPDNYQEALTINAQTGVPISFTGGTPGQTAGVTVTYQVSRVTLSDIEAGRL